MSEWRKELNGLLGARGRASRAEIENARFGDFLAQVVMPAYRTLGEELARHGRETVIREAPASATMMVRHGDVDEVSFRVLMRSLPHAIVPYAEVRVRKGLRLVRAESPLVETGNKAGLDSVTADDVIGCFLKHYRSAVVDSAKTC